MGKRELMIALGFAVAGLVAYALTATPPADSPSRPGLGTFVDRLRDETAGSAVKSVITTTGTIPLGPDAAELDLSTFPRVDVRGEARADIAWTLSTEARGADEAAAANRARAVTLSHDDRGAVIALSTRLPDGPRRVTTSVELVVPAHLQLTISDGRGGRVQRVRAVSLEGASGAFRLAEIAGPVTGSHRNGALEVQGAESVRLNLVGTQAAISQVRGEVVVTCRNGSCAFDQTHGSLIVDAMNSSLAVNAPAGDTRLTVANGQLTVTAPKAPLHVDVRRAATTLTLATAVPATVVASEAKLTVELAAALPITIDAVAERGAIDATSLGLEPEVAQGTATLRHAFGQTARVSLRNDRGDIVIVRRY